MDRLYFSGLTDYVLWVNERVIGWLDQIEDRQWKQEFPGSFSSIEQTVIHLVSAEKIWTDFWKGTPGPVFLSSVFKGTKEELITIWRHTSAELKNLVSAVPESDYRKPVSFKVRDEEWQLEFWQSFSHFVNHGTYHRGQLVTQLRQAGFTALTNTDLATFFRLNQ